MRQKGWPELMHDQRGSQAYLQIRQRVNIVNSPKSLKLLTVVQRAKILKLGPWMLREWLESCWNCDLLLRYTLVFECEPAEKPNDLWSRSHRCRSWLYFQGVYFGNDCQKKTWVRLCPLHSSSHSDIMKIFEGAIIHEKTAETCIVCVKLHMSLGAMTANSVRELICFWQYIADDYASLYLSKG